MPGCAPQANKNPCCAPREEDSRLHAGSSRGTCAENDHFRRGRIYGEKTTRTELVKYICASRGAAVCLVCSGQNAGLLERAKHFTSWHRTFSHCGTTQLQKAMVSPQRRAIFSSSTL